MTKTTGLILAAGRGSRMKQATESLPKGLVNLVNNPLLSWQKNALNAAGIHDVVAVGGYKSELINAVVPTRFVSKDWETSNMVRSLYCANELLANGTTIISYSDIAYHSDIVSSLMSSEADIALTCDRLWRDLWEIRFTEPLSDAESFKIKDGMIVEIGKRCSNYADIEAQYMGLIKVTATGWTRIKSFLDTLSDSEINSLDMTSLLSRLIEHGIPVAAVEIDGKWVEADNESDLEKYEKLALQVDKEGTIWSHDWR